MSIEEAATKALVTIFTWDHLLALWGGVLLGLTMGILPGLGGTAGLAIILPFLFGVEPSLALAMMIGVQSVTTTSDTFPSVLMGIPGTAGSQATVVDGFPMSKRGEGARALSAAFIASLFGGVFGAAVLSFAIFFAIPILDTIGFGEQMMLIVLALTMIGMLTGLNPVKGFASCGLGLMLGALGASPMTGEVRLSFDTEYLIEPVPLVVLGLSMFATPEIVDLLRRQHAISKSEKLGSGWRQGFRDWCENWWLSLRCAVIGCLVGALPGLGGTVIDWIAYSHAIQTTDNKESYGTGDVRGVIAPESANNAKEGGALIPTILFGIPGSGGMAILLGGFVLIGIEPGIELVTDQLDLVYIMIWSIAIANIVGAGLCMVLAGQLAKITLIRYVLVAPFMFGIVFFAAFQATRDWGDLIALFLLSALGVYMKRFGWQRPALLIGFVLAEKVEESVYHAIKTYGLTFLERPVVLLLVVFTIGSVIAAAKFKPPLPEMHDDGPHTHIRKWPQGVFVVGVLVFTFLLLFDTLHLNWLSSIYPQMACGLTLVFMVPLALQMFFLKRPHSIFYDSEREEFSEHITYRTSEHYMGWLLLMLGVSALVGFVIGIAAYTYIFLRVKGGVRHAYCALNSFAFICLLGTIQHLMTLEYPRGVLQWYFKVNLPWPLQ
ncbi:MAG: tripartite tricarboxylate transporter permease [Proteobacteria bacterium]|nr:tripartite tricarboxylate transporter permease [Pseudomonadota bacterium]